MIFLATNVQAVTKKASNDPLKVWYQANKEKESEWSGQNENETKKKN